MTTAHLGISVDSSAATGAAVDLDKLAAAAARAEKAEDALARANRQAEGATQRAGQATQAAMRDLRGFGGAVQQIGYQVGDFAVQVASGQNALIALTQQGSQVLGAFGPWGAVFGAAGAVVGALSIGLMGNASATDDAADAQERLLKSLDALDALNSTVNDLDELRLKYGEVTEAVRELIRAQQEQQIRQISADIRTLVGDVNGLAEAYDEYVTVTRLGAGATVSEIRDVASATEDLAKNIAKVSQDEGFAAAAEAAADMRDRLIEAHGSFEEMPPSAQNLYDKLIEVEDSLQQAEKTTADFRNGLDDAATSTSFVEEGIRRAVDQASALADEVARAQRALASFGETAAARMERAQIGLEFRGDPVGEARALAEAEGRRLVSDVQQSAMQDIPAMFRPEVIQRAKEYAAEVADTAAWTAQLEQETQRLNRAERESARGGKSASSKAEREAEREAQQAARQAAEEQRREIDALVREVRRQEEAYGDSIISGERYIAVMQMEAQSVGLTREAANRLRYEFEFLADAQREGIELTPEQVARYRELAATMASTGEQTYALQEAFDFTRDTVGGFFHDFKRGIEDGKGIWAAFANAATSAIDRVTDRLLNQLLDAIFEVNSAASGGGGGGWLGKLLGVAVGAFGGAAAGGFSTGSFSGGNYGYFEGLSGTSGAISLQPFARGGIVSRPTTFAMANGGVGLMGERAPEAIIPLARGRSGRLGVEVSGAAPGVTLIVNDYAGVAKKTEQRQTQTGQHQIVLDLLQAENIQRGGSRTNQALQTRGYITGR